MRVDVRNSRYQERSDVTDEFDASELRHCRLLLRRLRFLETQTKQQGMDRSQSGGAVFAEMEMAALEWALTELDFLQDQGN